MTLRRLCLLETIVVGMLVRTLYHIRAQLFPYI